MLPSGCEFFPCDSVKCFTFPLFEHDEYRGLSYATFRRKIAHFRDEK